MGISIDMCVHVCLNECMRVGTFLAMCMQVRAGVQKQLQMGICIDPGICTEQKNTLVQIAEMKTCVYSGRVCYFCGIFVGTCSSICGDSRAAIHVDELRCICIKTCTPMRCRFTKTITYIIHRFIRCTAKKNATGVDASRHTPNSK